MWERRDLWRGIGTENLWGKNNFNGKSKAQSCWLYCISKISNKNKFWESCSKCLHQFLTVIHHLVQIYLDKCVPRTSCTWSRESPKFFLFLKPDYRWLISENQFHYGHCGRTWSIRKDVCEDRDMCRSVTMFDHCDKNRKIIWKQGKARIFPFLWLWFSISLFVPTFIDVNLNSSQKLSEF